MGAWLLSRRGIEIAMTQRAFPKRALLMGGAALIGGGITMGWFGGQSKTASSSQSRAFAVARTEDEWKRMLTAEQFHVLRRHGTERAGTSPLDKEKRAGTFVCAGCDLPLFQSAAKFDSRTGWPSFFQPIDGAAGESPDNTLFMSRTEVHCSRCGGHLGHVFNDGPQPTGLRYCMNGVAMKFVPESA